jgi:hypothetical protein
MSARTTAISRALSSGLKRSRSSFFSRSFSSWRSTVASVCSAIGNGLAAAFSLSVFGLLKTGQCLKIVVGVAHSLARKFLFCCPAPQAQRLP